jgi:hypothetical protein
MFRPYGASLSVFQPTHGSRRGLQILRRSAAVANSLAAPARERVESGLFPITGTQPPAKKHLEARILRT